MEDINRSRTAFLERMRQLEKTYTSDANELDFAMKQWVSAAKKHIRSVIVKNLVDCFARMVATTPIDTGRARAAWMITTSPSNEVPDEGLYPQYKNNIANAIKESIPDDISLEKSDVIWVINNVEYILALDAGWSKHQRGGFIGRFIKELTEQLNRATRAA